MDAEVCEHRYTIWGNSSRPLMENLNEATALAVIDDHPEEYYGVCDYCNNTLNT